jgi:ectoine hydroxylase-related dioxygenase (phytanoyl-CoA dioxygenase family)
MVNMLVMLDDFTVENGATYVLTGSHHAPERPQDEFFQALHKVQV